VQGVLGSLNFLSLHLVEQKVAGLIDQKLLKKPSWTYLNFLMKN
jgi:hypothetical protein